jgi:glucoamylase
MDLDAWITATAEGAARSLRGAVSATHLTHRRAVFGRIVRPARGSVLASPVSAHWDPEPDYFFHWPRDAAAVMARIPQMMGMGPGWDAAFAEIIAFSLAATDPDAAPLRANPSRPTTLPDGLRHLRPDADLAALTGPARMAEPRTEADGTPDLERWSRPQHDGPALRASACMAVIAAAPDLDSPAVGALIARDLAFCAAVAGMPSVGPWEEEPARADAFTAIAQWDALTRAGRDGARAMAVIDASRDPATGAILSHPGGALDAGVVLAILGAGRADGPLALTCPAVRATMAGLEDLFAGLYPINHGATPPLIGRNAADVFFGGNPWLPTTLGFAELLYHRAALAHDGADLARAEGYMARLRGILPPGDALPEQIDRSTGAPTSARELSWSAAAFLGAAEARRAAIRALR